MPQSLLASAGLLAVAALVIAVFGTRLTAVAGRLADRTGLGEAFMGGVFLGAITSLPGITASVAAAVRGHAELALSNAIGGIAAQTAFLAVADLAYRHANLEHAAASASNLLQACLLVVLLGLFLVGDALPPWAPLLRRASADLVLARGVAGHGPKAADRRGTAVRPAGRSGREGSGRTLVRHPDPRGTGRRRPRRHRQHERPLELHAGRALPRAPHAPTPDLSGPPGNHDDSHPGPARTARRGVDPAARH